MPCTWRRQAPFYTYYRPCKCSVSHGPWGMLMLFLMSGLHISRDPASLSVCNGSASAYRKHQAKPRLDTQARKRSRSAAPDRGLTRHRFCSLIPIRSLIVRTCPRPSAVSSITKNDTTPTQPRFHTCQNQNGGSRASIRKVWPSHSSFSSTGYALLSPTPFVFSAIPKTAPRWVPRRDILAP